MTKRSVADSLRIAKSGTNDMVLPLEGGDDKKVAIEIGAAKINSSIDLHSRTAQSIVGATSCHTDDEPAST
jgi:hypothetical protein